MLLSFVVVFPGHIESFVDIRVYFFLLLWCLLCSVCFILFMAQLLQFNCRSFFFLLLSSPKGYSLYIDVMWPVVKLHLCDGIFFPSKSWMCQSDNSQVWQASREQKLNRTIEHKHGLIEQEKLNEIHNIYGKSEMWKDEQIMWKAE